VVEPGRRFSGRSMLRPYGILLRQHASGSRKREQAPALHRVLAWLNFESGGGENSIRAGPSQRTLGESLGIHGTGPALPFANTLKVNSFGIHEKADPAFAEF
jgi:hypothetical protein